MVVGEWGGWQWVIVAEQRWRATDGGGRMRVGVVMVGEGVEEKEYGLAIKSYNLQHTLGNNTYAMESINVCIM